MTNIIHIDGQHLSARLLEEAEYPREVRGLARLLGIKCAVAADMKYENRLDIMNRLAAAWRTEVARGKARHYLYDVNRHINLAAALERELNVVGEIQDHLQKQMRERAREIVSIQVGTEAR